MRWAKVDLHIHTPASSLCYAQKDVRFIDILRKAEEKELDVIAITDHNTVAGISAFRRRLETLQFLQEQHRLSEEEQAELDEYYRIMNRVLVLPGFEFTATLGFHILAIFPPQTSIRKLEHILLELNVPENRLDEGTSEIGATTDVLTAYTILDRAGALVIAAHANSTHGVAMQNFNFGGQTKISYTQDPHLHALEVTDLASRSRRSTAQFYSGTKAEYPRRMHCIQGSDAHRLERESEEDKGLGIGDRCTEMLLPEVSFEAIKELLTSDDFSRTRPSKVVGPFDAVRHAQESGPSLTTCFHERPTLRNKGYDHIVRDVVALANTNGGVIYIGAGASKGNIRGVERPDEVIEGLRRELDAKVAPKIGIEADTITSGNKSVVAVTVPKGTDTPYVQTPSQVWVRREGETALAVRDELVHLVIQTLADNRSPVPVEEESEGAAKVEPAGVEPPGTGVEIVETVERNGINYHTVKDLRNGSVVQNVTRFSARRLWRYAINEQESNPPQPEDIAWKGDLGLWKTYRHGGELRYNLAQRDDEGRLHVYYGVTEEGLRGPWREFSLGESAEQPNHATNGATASQAS